MRRRDAEGLQLHLPINANNTPLLTHNNETALCSVHYPRHRIDCCCSGRMHLYPAQLYHWCSFWLLLQRSYWRLLLLDAEHPRMVCSIQKYDRQLVGDDVSRPKLWCSGCSDGSKCGCDHCMCERCHHLDYKLVLCSLELEWDSRSPRPYNQILFGAGRMQAS